MWMLRKFYGGNGGAIPPTDPRLLAMTPELIELEFEHMSIDTQKKSGGEAYQDEGYEDYERESDSTDSLSTDTPEGYGGDNSDPHHGLTLPPEAPEDSEWLEMDMDDEDEDEDSVAADVERYGTEDDE